VLDELRRERGAVIEPADIARPVDDREMAAFVDEAGIAGFQPAIRSNRLPAFLGLLVIALEDPGRAHLDLTMLGDADIHSTHHATDGFRIDLRIGLHRAEPRQFSGAVHLLQIDAEGAEEAEDIDAERCAAGVHDPGAAQPELVAY